MTNFGKLADELESDFPAVDVTTVVFSSDFAGVGCCVIPQERVVVIADEIYRLTEELELANQKREFAEFEWNRATEHAQKRDAELAAARKALEFIVEGYDNHDVNHLDYRVKVYEVALDALQGQSK